MEKKRQQKLVFGGEPKRQVIDPHQDFDKFQMLNKARPEKMYLAWGYDKCDAPYIMEAPYIRIHSIDKDQAAQFKNLTHAKQLRYSFDTYSWFFQRDMNRSLCWYRRKLTQAITGRVDEDEAVEDEAEEEDQITSLKSQVVNLESRLERIETYLNL